MIDEAAKIGNPHVNVDLAAGDGGAVIWPLLTDIHTAKELLMTRRLLSKTEAPEMGLVNYMVLGEEVSGDVRRRESLALGGEKPSFPSRQDRR